MVKSRPQAKASPRTVPDRPPPGAVAEIGHRSSGAVDLMIAYTLLRAGSPATWSLATTSSTPSLDYLVTDLKTCSQALAERKSRSVSPQKLRNLKLLVKFG
jgi:hypothetical protein